MLFQYLFSSSVPPEHRSPPESPQQPLCPPGCGSSPGQDAPTGAGVAVSVARQGRCSPHLWFGSPLPCPAPPLEACCATGDRLRFSIVRRGHFSLFPVCLEAKNSGEKLYQRAHKSCVRFCLFSPVRRAAWLLLKFCLPTPTLTPAQPLTPQAEAEEKPYQIRPQLITSKALCRVMQVC